MNLLEGKLLAEGQRIGIVAGRFNEFITSKLLVERWMLSNVMAEMRQILTWLGFRVLLKFR